MSKNGRVLGRGQGQEFGPRARTIAIDCAVCARLFAITLDLFAATFVAGAPNAAPLLERRRLRSHTVLRMRAIPDSHILVGGKGGGIGLLVVIVWGVLIVRVAVGASAACRHDRIWKNPSSGG